MLVWQAVWNTASDSGVKVVYHRAKGQIQHARPTALTSTPETTWNKSRMTTAARYVILVKHALTDFFGHLGSVEKDKIKLFWWT